VLDSVRGDPATPCVLLGAEHYGPLVPWHSGLRLCTLSAGRYAYVVQGSGLRSLAAGRLPPAVLAVVPSIAHCTVVPSASLCRRLPFAFPPSTRADHSALLHYLEKSWQTLLNGAVAYAVFSLAAGHIKSALSSLVS